MLPAGRQAQQALAWGPDDEIIRDRVRKPEDAVRHGHVEIVPDELDTVRAAQAVDRPHRLTGRRNRPDRIARSHVERTVRARGH